MKRVIGIIVLLMMSLVLSACVDISQGSGERERVLLIDELAKEAEIPGYILSVDIPEDFVDTLSTEEFEYLLEKTRDYRIEQGTMSPTCAQAEYDALVAFNQKSLELFGLGMYSLESDEQMDTVFDAVEVDETLLEECSR